MVAQSVEQCPFKALVRGSSPRQPTSYSTTYNRTLTVELTFSYRRSYRLPVEPEKRTPKFGPTRGGLRRYERTGVYHINAKVHGRTIQESTETASLKAAKKILAEKIAEARKAAPAHPAAAKEKTTFEAIIDDFKNRIEGDATSPKTKLKRSHVLASFIRSWSQVPEIVAAGRSNFQALQPSEVTERDLLAWRKAFLAKYSGDYFNKTLSLLRRLFDLAKRSYRFYGSDPTEAIAWAKVQQTEITLPTREQFDQLLALFDAYKSHGGTVWKKACDTRDFVEGLAWTGLRKEEANLLRVRHVDLKEGVIRLSAEIVKNRRNARTVPLIERAKPLFERLVTESSAREGKIFAINECQKTLDKLCKAVPSPRITHHDLRHYFASLALHFTKDAKLVAKWLGHSDGGVLVMRVYAHIFSEHEQEAVKAMKF